MYSHKLFFYIKIHHGHCALVIRLKPNDNLAFAYRNMSTPKQME